MRRALIALAAVAHAAMLAALLPMVPAMGGDSGRYVALAHALRLGAGFGLETGGGFEPEAWRLPGYPAFIALCHALFGVTPRAVVAVQAVLFLIAVALVWRAAARLFGDATGLTFLVVSAAYPFVAYSAGQISSEMLAAFLLALALYSLVDVTLPRAALAGAFAGLAGYVRPNLVGLGLVFAIACVAAGRATHRAAIVVGVSAGLVALPWAIRNHATFGVFTPLPVIGGAGSALFFATWESRVAPPNIGTDADRSGLNEQIWRVNVQADAPDADPISIEPYPGNTGKAIADRLLIDIALENIRERPWAFAWRTAKNAPRLWFARHFPPKWPAIVRGALVADGVLVLLAGAAGIVIALGRPERHPAVLAAAGTLLYLTATLCWFDSESRFTIPARLILVAFAAHGLRVGFSRLARRPASAGPLQTPH